MKKATKWKLALLIPVIGALYWTSIPHNRKDCELYYLKNERVKSVIQMRFAYCRREFPG